MRERKTGAKEEDAGRYLHPSESNERSTCAWKFQMRRTPAVSLLREYEWKKPVRNKSHFGPIYLIKYGNSGILNQPERARYRGKRKRKCRKRKTVTATESINVSHLRRCWGIGNHSSGPPRAAQRHQFTQKIARPAHHRAIASGNALRTQKATFNAGSAIVIRIKT